MEGMCGAACGEELPADGDHVICGTCGAGIHYVCSNLTKEAWESLSVLKKKAWRCTTCREARQLRSEASSQGSNFGDNKDKGKKKTGNSEFEEILDRKLGELQKKMDKKIDSKFNELVETINFVETTTADTNKMLKGLEKRIVVMEKKQDTLEAQNAELRKKVKDLEVFVQDMAQEKNQNKLEISGVPKNVDCPGFVTRVLEKAQVLDTVVKKGEYNVTKVEKRKGEVPVDKMGVIVTLKNQETRDAILQVLREKKPNLTTEGIVTQNPPTPVFINEYLTPYMKKLFYEAKRIKKEKNYEYLWVRKGQILLKKQANGNVIRLTSLTDLAKI